VKKKEAGLLRPPNENYALKSGVRSCAAANILSDAALRTTPCFTHDNPHFCINDTINLPITLFPTSHQFWLHATPGLSASQTHDETRMNKGEI
jgi:hypothetical protein